MTHKEHDIYIVVLAVLICVLMVLVPYWLIEYFTDNSIYGVLGSVIVIALYLGYAMLSLIDKTEKITYRYMVGLEERIEGLEDELKELQKGDEI